MNRNHAYVELVDGLPVRIFRTRQMAVLSPAYEAGRVGTWPRAQAVTSIRQSIFQRSNGECERCGERILWRGFHMDERVSRGEGGEIGLENSWALCANCHILHQDSEHGERRWNGRKAN